MARATKRKADRPLSKSAAKPAPAAAGGYASWKKAARAILKEQHGIDAPTVRERDWRIAFITGAPPDAGAEIAWRNHSNTHRPAERTRKR